MPPLAHFVDSALLTALLRSTQSRYAAFDNNSAIECGLGECCYLCRACWLAALMLLPIHAGREEPTRLCKPASLMIHLSAR